MKPFRSGRYLYIYKKIAVACKKCGKKFAYETKAYDKTGTPIKKRSVCDKCDNLRRITTSRKWRKDYPEKAREANLRNSKARSSRKDISKRIRPARLLLNQID